MLSFEETEAGDKFLRGRAWGSRPALGRPRPRKEHEDNEPHDRHGRQCAEHHQSAVLVYYVLTSELEVHEQVAEHHTAT